MLAHSIAEKGGQGVQLIHFTEDGQLFVDSFDLPLPCLRVVTTVGKNYAHMHGDNRLPGDCLVLPPMIVPLTSEGHYGIQTPEASVEPRPSISYENTVTITPMPFVGETATSLSTAIYGTFTPTATFRPTQTNTATFTLTPQSLTISGTTTFGNIDRDGASYGEQTLTISNPSGSTRSGININAIPAGWTYQSADAGSTCGVEPISIAGLSSCAMILRFVPPNVGTNSGTFTLQDQLSLQVSTSLSGTGIPLVKAAYPINGSRWTQFIVRDYTLDDFHQTDTSCPVTANPANRIKPCIHGAEILKVSVWGKSSCTNLTASDSLDVFDWRCSVESGTATFFSILKANKSLRDLVTATPSPGGGPQ